jgi:hypothetical protein
VCCAGTQQPHAQKTEIMAAAISFPPSDCHMTVTWLQVWLDKVNVNAVRNQGL